MATRGRSAQGFHQMEHKKVVKKATQPPTFNFTAYSTLTHSERTNRTSRDERAMASNPASTDVSNETYSTLKASLLNESGNVPLHERYRTLFTLKSLKTEKAVEIISAGMFLILRLKIGATSDGFCAWFKGFVTRARC